MEHQVTVVKRELILDHLGDHLGKNKSKPLPIGMILERDMGKDGIYHMYEGQDYRNEYAWRLGYNGKPVYGPA